MTRTNPKRTSRLGMIQGHSSKAEFDHVFAKLQSIINLSERSQSKRRSTLIKIPALVSGDGPLMSQSKDQVSVDLLLDANQSFMDLPLDPELSEHLQACELRGSSRESLLNDQDISSNCRCDVGVTASEGSLPPEPGQPTTQGTPECTTGESRRSNSCGHVDISSKRSACNMWPARPQEQPKIGVDISQCLEDIKVTLKKRELCSVSRVAPPNRGNMTVIAPRITKGRVTKVCGPPRLPRPLPRLRRTAQLNSCAESNIAPGGSSNMVQYTWYSSQGPIMERTPVCDSDPCNSSVMLTCDQVQAEATDTRSVTRDQVSCCQPASDNNRLLSNSLARNWSKFIADELATSQQSHEYVRTSWFGEVKLENSEIHLRYVKGTSQHQHLTSHLEPEREPLMDPWCPSPPDTDSVSDGTCTPVSPKQRPSFESPPLSPSSHYSLTDYSCDTSTGSSPLLTCSKREEDHEDPMFDELAPNSEIEQDHEPPDQEFADAGAGYSPDAWQPVDSVSEQDDCSPDAWQSVDVVSEQDDCSPDAWQPVDSVSEQDDCSPDAWEPVDSVSEQDDCSPDAWQPVDSESEQDDCSPDAWQPVDSVSEQDYHSPDAWQSVDAESEQDDYSDDGEDEEDEEDDEEDDEEEDGYDDPEYESDAPQSPDPEGSDEDDDSPDRQLEDSDDPEDGDANDSKKADNQGEDPNMFTDKARASSLLSAMYELYQSSELCDVTLLVNDRQFPCHKNVLVASSHYFKSMFTCNLAETTQKEVRINSMSAVIMETVLKYLYTGSVKLSQEIVQDMMSAADFLNLKELKIGCASYMRGHLDNNNVLGVYFFAESLGCDDLQYEAKTLVYSNFRDIKDVDEFVELTDRNLKEILQWDLGQVTETEVYEAVVKWLEHDPDKRRDSVYDVFSNVRFAVIINRDRFFFYDKVMSNRMLTGDPSMKSLLDEVVQYSMLKERRMEYDFITNDRCDMVLSLIIFTAKKKPESIRLDTVAYYHDSDYKVPKLSELYSNKISDVTLLAADNQLFMLGGVKTSHDRVSLSRKMYSWCCDRENFIDHSNEPLDVLKYKRKNFPFVQVDRDLFAIGGRAEDEILLSVEVLKKNQYAAWERSLAYPLPKPLASSCAVGFEGNLYVFGGESYEIKRGRKSHHHISDNVYCLKPNQGVEWEPVGNMKQARAWAGCTILNKKIYVIGGGYWDKKSKTKVARALESVEIFDPRSKTWSDGPPLPVPLISPGVVKYLGTIYVLGGKYENATSNSVYYLDKDTSAWVQTHDLFDSDKLLSLECVTDCSYTVVDMPCRYYTSPSVNNNEAQSSTDEDGASSDYSDDIY